MSEFWNMGGYAAYVWSSYGVSAGVLGLCVATTYIRLAWLKRQLRRRETELDDPK